MACIPQPIVSLGSISTDTGDSFQPTDGGVPSLDGDVPETPEVDLSLANVAVFPKPNGIQVTGNVGLEGSSAQTTEIEFRLCTTAGCNDWDTATILSEIGAFVAQANGFSPFDEVIVLGRLPGPGPYFVGIAVDPDDRIRETNEANNREAFALSTPSAWTFDPTSLDFGLVDIGLSVERCVNVRNDAPSPQTIQGHAIAGQLQSMFEITSQITYPVSVAPAASMQICVRYAPVATGTHAGELVLHNGVGSVALLGRARDIVTTCGARTETFTDSTHPAIDVLLVVDNTGSMGDEQAQLSADMDQLYAALVAVRADYRVAVTSMDVARDGGQALAFVTPTTPDPLGALRQGVRLGTNGDPGNERGLEAARLAVFGGIGAGFPRGGAGLVLLFVSDEDDQSPAPIADYVSGFRAGRTGGVVANGIVLTTSATSVCTTVVAPRYLDVVAQLGGTAAAICDSNWTPAVATWPDTNFGDRVRFRLGDAAKPSSVVVRIDGNVVPNAHYDAALNSIVLPTRLPDGSVLTVTYEWRGC